MVALSRRRFPIVVIIAIVLFSFSFAFPKVRAAERAFIVEMRSFQFLPNVLQVEPGDIVTIRVFNNDTTGHTFDLPQFGVQIGTRASPFQPGQNATRTFTADRSGTFWFFCDIPGHASPAGSGYTGMAGRLIVGASAAPFDATILVLGAIGVAIVAGIIGVVVWRRRTSGKP